jgi:hypothetical protein
VQRDSHASCRNIANDLDPGFNAEFDEDNDRLPPGVVPNLAYHSSTGALLWDLFYGRAVPRAT